MYGERPFDTGDESRNNWLVALVSLGEGWHHNHHAFPTSARHGLAPTQIDPSYGIIRVMEALGLASNVRRPAAADVARKRPAPAGARPAEATR
jgi:stearoyl-CoA desaturase (delta-9 desaturase)